MHIHFIAIGGSIMHNLAIALKQKGYHITGSDDEIFDPALSKLTKYGLMPKFLGWDAERIDSNIDAVILGMHAHGDNPELNRAKELAIPVYSFPEFIYEQSKSKRRIVVGGSHGKTTTTAMIMHVLKEENFNFDYMVGAQLDGFELTVKLSDANVIVLEGDEYPDSAINRTPKFHLYNADIGVITGIAWDHINVFPTYESYINAFKVFASELPQTGALIYNNDDAELTQLIGKTSISAKKIPYQTPTHEIKNGKTYIVHDQDKYELSVFGIHNLQNIMAAFNVCRLLNITDKAFFNAIKSFKGAAKRLELIAASDVTNIYRDFAHSPSKLKATIDAVKSLFPTRKLTACLELHTYSSLNKNFLKEYADSMKAADERIVFYSPHAVEMKRLEVIDKNFIKQAFNDPELTVYTHNTELLNHLRNTQWENRNLLMMSSGTFDGIDYNSLGTFAKIPVNI